MASPIPPTPKSFESTSLEKYISKSSKNVNAWAPETSETEPQIFPIRVQITPRGGEVDQKITAGAKIVAHFILGAVLVGLGRVSRANIVPSWRPKSKENR